MSNRKRSMVGRIRRLLMSWGLAPRRRRREPSALAASSAVNSTAQSAELVTVWSVVGRRRPEEREAVPFFHRSQAQQLALYLSLQGWTVDVLQCVVEPGDRA